MELVSRVKNIIVTPATEWQAIDRESGDVGYVFTYVAILAAIPAVCGFIGTKLIGVPLGTALIAAILGYVLSFVTVYVVALITDALAPSFGGRKDFGSALKLTAYSYTPAWVVGIFSLVPYLGFLAILGLYGIYLLYLGLPTLMKCPKDRAVLYAVAIVVCAIIISFIISAIIGWVLIRSLI